MSCLRSTSLWASPTPTVTVADTRVLAHRPHSSRERLATRAGRMVSGSSAAVFRIAFGVVGLLLVLRFFVMGWIDQLYLEPVYHFPYPGFEWVKPWPGAGMYVHFAVMGLAAVCISVGYRYRLASVTFAVTLAYAELIDRTLYLNHYYWMALTAAVMVFLPLDSTLAVGRHGATGIPIGVVWLLRFQVGMVYFFAGLAKVNADWLFGAEPLSTWLPARSDMWLIGPALTQPATAYVLSWVGAIFDLTVVGWLLWRRSRLIAFAFLVGFHTMTWLLFPSIGVFPLLMSLGATVFFDPDWPDRLLRRRAAPRNVNTRPPRAGWILAGIYCVVMIALPLRHHLMDDDVKWNGLGYLGSWQVMLSEKSGSATFLVTDPGTGQTWRVPPPSYLTRRQIEVMATDPVMIQQTAALVSADNGGAAVSADVRLSFNGRPSVRYTDPEVNIAPGRPPVETWLLAAPDQ